MSIAKEVDFVAGVTPIGEAYMDLLQEMLAAFVSPNFIIEQQSTTVLRVPAGNDSAAVGIAVNGQFRRRDTNVTVTVSGGAGTKSVYATADSGDNLFALEVTAGTPAATNYRKVGEVDWSGTTITAIRQEFPLSTKILALSADPLSAVPVGSIFQYPYAIAPAGYLLCQGQAVSRTTYSVLHSLASAAGYPDGSGDGSTTFNVPDFRRRIPIGKADSGAASTLAEMLGAWDHVHVGPSHNHSVPSHSHGATGLTTSTEPAHTHSIGTFGSTSAGSHSHGTGTYFIGNTDGVHSHTFSDSFTTGTENLSAVGHDPGSTLGANDDHTHSGSVSGTTSSTGAHGHGISGSSSSTGAHTHSTTIAATASGGSHDHTVSGSTAAGGAGSSGDSGTGNTGVANPPVRVVNFIIRAA